MRSIINLVSCDVRSLAVFRIALAVAVMVAASGDAGILAALVFVPAMFLLFGYRTRWSTIACWLLVVALHTRGSLAPGGTDTLLVTLLLLAVFLPLGARYSADLALDPAYAPGTTTTLATWQLEPRHVSVVTVALTLQILLVLVLAAIHSLDSASGPALTIRSLNWLCLSAPVLVLLPVLGGWLRFTAVIALIAALTAAAPRLAQSVPLLTLVAALLALVPACLWRWLSFSVALERRKELRIYFDRDCGFCRKTCHLFRTFFVLGDAPLIPAQEDKEAYEIMQHEVSWVVYDYDGTPFIRWHAVLLLLRRSPLLRPLGLLLTAIGMGRWGDPLYATIAASRGWLSKVTRVVLPYRREHPLTGRWVSVLAGIWLLAVIAITTLPQTARPSDGTAAIIRYALGLDQYWHLW